MSEKDWTPKHVRSEGLNDGSDCCDLFAKGITGEKFLQHLRDNIVEGMPRIKVKSVKSATTEKPKPKPEPKTSPAPKSNVVPIRQSEPDIDYGTPPEFSEDGLAESFTAAYQLTMKYCGTWFVWQEGRWQSDESGLAVDRARKICKLAAGDVMLKDEIPMNKRQTIANQVSKLSTYSAVEKIARTDRRHVVLPTKFDQRSMILNTPGGIVELKTGKLRPATKEDFCTLVTNATPEGDCPRWLQFMEEVTDGDKELQTYLQRIAGYCLTASIAEHAFFFCYGGGGNGKGTYINMLDWLLGTYSKVSNMETFTERKFTAHSTELAWFQGARLVTAQETDAGSRWNESRIKQLTGGDPITARHLYQSEFTFYPTFKLLFSGNNKPVIKNVDKAIRRRMYLIPFEYTVPDDKIEGNLQKHLQHNEGGGILRWAIDGCLDWQRYGLNPPERVRITTDEYFEDEDRIGAFFSECCEQGLTYRVPTTQLFQRYREWCEENGEYAFARPRFLASIAQKGFQSRNMGGSMCVQGIKLPDNYQPGGFR